MKKLKRVIATLLCLAMIFTSTSITALADGAGSAKGATDSYTFNGGSYSTNDRGKAVLWGYKFGFIYGPETPNFQASNPSMGITLGDIGDYDAYQEDVINHTYSKLDNFIFMPIGIAQPGISDIRNMRWDPAEPRGYCKDGFTTNYTPGLGGTWYDKPESPAKEGDEVNGVWSIMAYYAHTVSFWCCRGEDVGNHDNYVKDRNRIIFNKQALEMLFACITNQNAAADTFGDQWTAPVMAFVNQDPNARPIFLCAEMVIICKYGNTYTATSVDDLAAGSLSSGYIDDNAPTLELSSDGTSMYNDVSAKRTADQRGSTFPYYTSTTKETNAARLNRLAAYQWYFGRNGNQSESGNKVQKSGAAYMSNHTHTDRLITGSYILSTEYDGIPTGDDPPPYTLTPTVGATFTWNLDSQFIPLANSHEQDGTHIVTDGTNISGYYLALDDFSFQPISYAAWLELMNKSGTSLTKESDCYFEINVTSVGTDGTPTGYINPTSTLDAGPVQLTSNTFKYKDWLEALATGKSKKIFLCDTKYTDPGVAASGLLSAWGPSAQPTDVEHSKIRVTYNVNLILHIPGVGDYDLGDTPEHYAEYAFKFDDRTYTLWQRMSNAQAQIKADEIGESKFDVVNGVPTTENMYISMGGSEFIINMQYRYHIDDYVRKYEVNVSPTPNFMYYKAKEYSSPTEKVYGSNIVYTPGDSYIDNMPTEVKENDNIGFLSYNGGEAADKQHDFYKDKLTEYGNKVCDTLNSLDSNIDTYSADNYAVICTGSGWSYNYDSGLKYNGSKPTGKGSLESFVKGSGNTSEGDSKGIYNKTIQELVKLSKWFDTAHDTIENNYTKYDLASKLYRTTSGGTVAKIYPFALRDEGDMDSAMSGSVSIEFKWDSKNAAPYEVPKAECHTYYTETHPTTVSWTSSSKTCANGKSWTDYTISYGSKHAHKTTSPCGFAVKNSSDHDVGSELCPDYTGSKTKTWTTHSSCTAADSTTVPPTSGKCSTGTGSSTAKTAHTPEKHKHHGHQRGAGDHVDTSYNTGDNTWKADQEGTHNKLEGVDSRTMPSSHAAMEAWNADCHYEINVSYKADMYNSLGAPMQQREVSSTEKTLKYDGTIYQRFEGVKYMDIVEASVWRLSGGAIMQEDTTSSKGGSIIGLDNLIGTNNIAVKLSTSDPEMKTVIELACANKGFTILDIEETETLNEVTKWYKDLSHYSANPFIASDTSYATKPYTPRNPLLLQEYMNVNAGAWRAVATEELDAIGRVCNTFENNLQPYTVNVGGGTLDSNNVDIWSKGNTPDNHAFVPTSTPGAGVTFLYDPNKQGGRSHYSFNGFVKQALAETFYDGKKATELGYKATVAGAATESSIAEFAYKAAYRNYMLVESDYMFIGTTPLMGMQYDTSFIDEVALKDPNAGNIELSRKYGLSQSLLSTAYAGAADVGSADIFGYVLDTSNGSARNDYWKYGGDKSYTGDKNRDRYMNSGENNNGPGLNARNVADGESSVEFKGFGSQSNNKLCDLQYYTDFAALDTTTQPEDSTTGWAPKDLTSVISIMMDYNDTYGAWTPEKINGEYTKASGNMIVGQTFLSNFHADKRKVEEETGIDEWFSQVGYNGTGDASVAGHDKEPTTPPTVETFNEAETYLSGGYKFKYELSESQFASAPVYTGISADLAKKCYYVVKDGVKLNNGATARISHQHDENAADSIVGLENTWFPYYVGANIARSAPNTSYGGFGSALVYERVVSIDHTIDEQGNLRLFGIVPGNEETKKSIGVVDFMKGLISLLHEREVDGFDAATAAKLLGDPVANDLIVPVEYSKSAASAESRLASGSKTNAVNVFNPIAAKYTKYIPLSKLVPDGTNHFHDDEEDKDVVGYVKRDQRLSTRQVVNVTQKDSYVVYDETISKEDVISFDENVYVLRSPSLIRTVAFQSKDLNEPTRSEIVVEGDEYTITNTENYNVVITDNSGNTFDFDMLLTAGDTLYFDGKTLMYKSSTQTSPDNVTYETLYNAWVSYYNKKYKVEPDLSVNSTIQTLYDDMSDKLERAIIQLNSIKVDGEQNSTWFCAINYVVTQLNTVITQFNDCCKNNKLLFTNDATLALLYGEETSIYTRIGLLKDQIAAFAEMYKEFSVNMEMVDTPTSWQATNEQLFLETLEDEEEGYVTSAFTTEWSDYKTFLTDREKEVEDYIPDEEAWSWHAFEQEHVPNYSAITANIASVDLEAKDLSAKIDNFEKILSETNKNVDSLRGAQDKLTELMKTYADNLETYQDNYAYREELLKEFNKEYALLFPAVTSTSDFSKLYPTVEVEIGDNVYNVPDYIQKSVNPLLTWCESSQTDGLTNPKHWIKRIEDVLDTWPELGNTSSSADVNSARQARTDMLEVVKALLKVNIPVYEYDYKYVVDGNKEIRKSASPDIESMAQQVSTNISSSSGNFSYGSLNSSREFVIDLVSALSSIEDDVASDLSKVQGDMPGIKEVTKTFYDGVIAVTDKIDASLAILASCTDEVIAQHSVINQLITDLLNDSNRLDAAWTQACKAYTDAATNYSSLLEEEALIKQCIKAFNDKWAEFITATGGIGFDKTYNYIHGLYQQLYNALEPLTALKQSIENSYTRMKTITNKGDLLGTLSGSTVYYAPVLPETVKGTVPAKYYDFDFKTIQQAVNTADSTLNFTINDVSWSTNAIIEKGDNIKGLPTEIKLDVVDMPVEPFKAENYLNLKWVKDLCSREALLSGIDENSFYYKHNTNFIKYTGTAEEDQREDNQKLPFDEVLFNTGTGGINEQIDLTYIKEFITEYEMENNSTEGYLYVSNLNTSRDYPLLKTLLAEFSIIENMQGDYYNSNGELTEKGVKRNEYIAKHSSELVSIVSQMAMCYNKLATVYNNTKFTTALKYTQSPDFKTTIFEINANNGSNAFDITYKRLKDIYDDTRRGEELAIERILAIIDDEVIIPTLTVLDDGMSQYYGDNYFTLQPNSVLTISPMVSVKAGAVLHVTIPMSDNVAGNLPTVSVNSTVSNSTYQACSYSDGIFDVVIEATKDTTIESIEIKAANKITITQTDVPFLSFDNIWLVTLGDIGSTSYSSTISSGVTLSDIIATGKLTANKYVFDSSGSNNRTTTTFSTASMKLYTYISDVDTTCPHDAANPHKVPNFNWRYYVIGETTNGGTGIITSISDPKLDNDATVIDFPQRSITVGELRSNAALVSRNGKWLLTTVELGQKHLTLKDAPNTEIPAIFDTFTLNDELDAGEVRTIDAYPNDYPLLKDGWLNYDAAIGAAGYKDTLSKYVYEAFFKLTDGGLKEEPLFWVDSAKNLYYRFAQNDRTFISSDIKDESWFYVFHNAYRNGNLIVDYCGQALINGLPNFKVLGAAIHEEYKCERVVVEMNWQTDWYMYKIISNSADISLTESSKDPNAYEVLSLDDEFQIYFDNTGEFAGSNSGGRTPARDTPMTSDGSGKGFNLDIDKVQSYPTNTNRQKMAYTTVPNASAVAWWQNADTKLPDQHDVESNKPTLTDTTTWMYAKYVIFNRDVYVFSKGDGSEPLGYTPTLSAYDKDGNMHTPVFKAAGTPIFLGYYAGDSGQEDNGSKFYDYGLSEPYKSPYDDSAMYCVYNFWLPASVGEHEGPKIGEESTINTDGVVCEFHTIAINDHDTSSVHNTVANRKGTDDANTSYAYNDVLLLNNNTTKPHAGNFKVIGSAGRIGALTIIDSGDPRYSDTMKVTAKPSENVEDYLVYPIIVRVVEYSNKFTSSDSKIVGSIGSQRAVSLDPYDVRGRITLNAILQKVAKIESSTESKVSESIVKDGKQTRSTVTTEYKTYNNKYAYNTYGAVWYKSATSVWSSDLADGDRLSNNDVVRTGLYVDILPLVPSFNRHQTFHATPTKIGYELWLTLDSIGDYYGTSSAMVEEGMDDAALDETLAGKVNGNNDYNQYKVQVRPFYSAMDCVTADGTKVEGAVDIYMRKGDSYILVYSGCDKVGTESDEGTTCEIPTHNINNNMLNVIYSNNFAQSLLTNSADTPDGSSAFNLDDNMLRRSISDVESRITYTVAKGLARRTLLTKVMPDPVVKDDITYDSFDTRYLYGCSQMLFLRDRNITYVGGPTAALAGKDTASAGFDNNRADNVDGLQHMQKWNFGISLPSSALFVKHGKTLNSSNVITKGYVALSVDVVATGNVWNLHYMSEISKYVMDINGKQYPFTSWNPSYVKFPWLVPVTYYDISGVSTDDLDTQGSH